jgi:Ni/Co efflux regulator RcnB
MIKRLLISVAALSLAAGTAAVAQPAPSDQHRAPPSAAGQGHGHGASQGSQPHNTGVFPRRNSGAQQHHGAAPTPAPNPARPGGHNPPSQGSRDHGGPDHARPSRGGPGHVGSEHRGRPEHRPSPRHERFRRGAHLPPVYRSDRYIIHDWHRYHLRPPRHGFFWVRVGDEFLLISRRTGDIVEIVRLP